MIVGGTEANARPFAESFLDGMRHAGQVPGRTVQIDLRYVGSSAMRAFLHARVAESPAVLVVGGLTAARYARDATTTVPIVVATSSDLVDAGIVQSLAVREWHYGVTYREDIAECHRLTEDVT